MSRATQILEAMAVHSDRNYRRRVARRAQSLIDQHGPKAFAVARRQGKQAAPDFWNDVATHIKGRGQ